MLACVCACVCVCNLFYQPLSVPVHVYCTSRSTLSFMVDPRAPSSPALTAHARKSRPCLSLSRIDTTLHLARCRQATSGTARSTICEQSSRTRWPRLRVCAGGDTCVDRESERQRGEGGSRGAGSEWNRALGPASASKDLATILQYRSLSCSPPALPDNTRTPEILFSDTNLAARRVQGRYADAGHYIAWVKTGIRERLTDKGAPQPMWLKFDGE